MPHKRRHRYVGKTKKKNEEDLLETLEKLSVKTNEESPKGLSDMPTDILGLVIDELDFKEHLILRKVSKPLRSLVDERKPSCKSIHILNQVHSTICKYDNQKIIYGSPRHFNSGPGVRVTRNYEKMAFDDLFFTLNNPDLKLDYFEFKTNIGFSEWRYIPDNKSWRNEKYNEIEDLLKSLHQQISTKTLKIDIFDRHQLPQLLPYFKPGVLEKIILSGRNWEGQEDVEVIKKVAEMEQWEQAVKLELPNIRTFPWEYAKHMNQTYTYRFQAS